MKAKLSREISKGIKKNIEDKITSLFCTYAVCGLIECNVEKICDLMADEVIGIGLGEQGLLSSKGEVKKLLIQIQKQDGNQDGNQDRNGDKKVTCFDMITNVIDETTANICGKVRQEKNGHTISVILQTLGFKCIQGSWKIVLFHASLESVTLQGAEEYPLPFADNMIQRLKKEIEETAKNIHLRKELELQRMAELDSLTLVYNKRAFENKVKEELEDKATMISGAFFMLDIDCFKETNDTYGHPFGDEVLLKMAQILVENYKETAIIGRLGGDEFGVFCYEKRTMEQRYAVLKEIQKKVHEILLPGSCGEHITCSIGIAKCESEDMTFEELYKRADASLYHVKRNGRDGYAFYEDITE